MFKFRFPLIVAALVASGSALAATSYVYRQPAVGLAPPVAVQLDALTTVDGARQWASGNLAASCNEYRNPAAGKSYSGDTGDGFYRVTLGGAPVVLYCDMTRDGGGWTMVVKAQSSSNAHSNTAAVGTLTGPGQATAWKLSDADINKLPKTMYRMTNSAGTFSLYFDTSDSFASTRQVANKASKSYATPVWEGPFYNAMHRGFNTYGTSHFNRADPSGVVYTGQSSGDSCRLAFGITGGIAGWCGAGDPGTTWLK